MDKKILIIKHIEIEGPGSIEYFFRSTPKSLKTINLAAGDHLPDDLKGVETVITLGGPMNVYEEADYPFLKNEDVFLKKAIRKKIPILGICLGAQLLAKACGAKVNKAPEKEIGWYEVDLTAEGERDPLFTGLSTKVEVFQWHEDTFEIPKKAVHLARSKSCSNQAFRFGKNAYGLQFHIEVTPPIIESWINEYVKEEASTETKNILIDAHRKKELFEKQANIIYSNFIKIISEK